MLSPYPFTTPVPPATPTTVDGTYTRSISVEVAGGIPVPCRRCPPYRIQAGTSTLILDRGRFAVTHVPKPARVPPGCEGCTKPAGFRSAGHFRVTDDRIVLFNDPNCTEEKGIYTWSVDEGVLTLEVVRDTCGLGGLRPRYFTAFPWKAGGG